MRELSDLGMRQAEADEPLSDLHTDRHRIEYRDARSARELGVVTAQAGTREDHHLRAIVGHDALDLRRELAERPITIRDALFDVDVDRSHRGALRFKAVVPHEILLIRNELLQHRERRE